VAIFPGVLAAAATGFGLGFLVAAQVGPIWLFCARTALRGGFLGGMAVGGGAALVDTGYAALGVAGAARLLQVPGLRVGFGLVGAVVLLVLGLRTLVAAWRMKSEGGLEREASSPGRAFQISLAATASNPLTIATWAAIFAAAAAAGVARSLPTAIALLVAVGIGSMTWFTILSGGMSLLRRRLPLNGIRLADTAAALGLLAFAVLLAWKSF
jgi:putative LysE/RhtB family amino acid efflux pump